MIPSKPVGVIFDCPAWLWAVCLHFHSTYQGASVCRNFVLLQVSVASPINNTTLPIKLYKINNFKQTLKNIVYPCLQRLQRRPSQSYCMCQTQLFKLHQSIIIMKVIFFQKVLMHVSFPKKYELFLSLKNEILVTEICLLK